MVFLNIFLEAYQKHHGFVVIVAIGAGLSIFNEPCHKPPIILGNAACINVWIQNEALKVNCGKHGATKAPTPAVESTWTLTSSM